jgi:dTDP-4-dehydrorhamnose reductase
VLGAKGQLGSELVRLLGPDSAVPHDELSITDLSATSRLINSRKPEVVFNCAAYNAVDRAESEMELANAVNAHGVYNVATVCADVGARLVHFSTNFVFEGSLDRPYLESDEPAPQSVYALSKLIGERMAMKASPRNLVLRTAAVFGGSGGQSFPEKILERARSGQPVRVVSDQRVNPTYTVDLARAALDLTRQGTAGIVHAVGEGCCGWDEFARAVLEECGVDVEVHSISSDEFPAPARRPRNGCLATARYRPLRSWRAALSEWVARQKEA